MSGLPESAPSPPVAVARSLAETGGMLRQLLTAVIPEVGPQPDDECANALARARI